MIRKVDRLVAGSVLATLLIAWLVLLGLDLLFLLAGELVDLGREESSLSGVLLQALWTLPRRAYDLFPSAALLGSILGLGALATSSELIALRAAGLSKLRICLSVLACVGVLTTAVMAMGETLAPYGERRAQAAALSTRSADLALARWSGLWAREGETFLNARSATLGGSGAEASIRLGDVRLFEFDDGGRLKRITLAEAARHRGDHWILEDVRRIRFAESRVESERMDSLTWASRLDPGVLSLGVMRPRYMAVSDLLRSLDYMERNELDATAFQAALWARLFYPMNALALCLCALPFAFGSLRSGGFGKGLFIGIVIGVGFWLSQRAFVNMAEVYALDMAAANGLPAVLLIVVAVGWLRRTA